MKCLQIMMMKKRMMIMPSKDVEVVEIGTDEALKMLGRLVNPR